jgi:hypothetical protein
MTVLLDKGKCGLGKFIPLMSLCILLVAVHKRRKLAMEKRHLLGQAKTSLGESNIPFNALFVGKRTIVDLGHDIKSLLERRLELTRDDANSRGERHWDKVGEEVLVRKSADRRKRRCWTGISHAGTRRDDSRQLHSAGDGEWGSQGRCNCATLSDRLLGSRDSRYPPFHHDKKDERERDKNQWDGKIWVRRKTYIKQKEDCISLNHTETHVEERAQVWHVLRPTENLGRSSFWI